MTSSSSITTGREAVRLWRTVLAFGAVLLVLAGLIAALHRAPKAGYRLYNIGGSHPVTLRALVEALEHALGRKAILDLRPAQPGDVERTFADISRARRELRWEPTTSLQEGLARFVGWLRDYRDLYRDPAESAATG